MGNISLKLRPDGPDIGRVSSRDPGIASDVEKAANAARRRANAIYVFFIVEILALTIFQKIGYGNTPDGVVPLNLPMMAAGLIALCVTIRPTVPPIRLILYFAFTSASVASTALFSDGFSISSVGLYLMLYLPMIPTFVTPEMNYRRCMEFFSRLMIGVCGIVVLQHLTQVAFSWQVWPNLDKLLPQNVLIQNYVYIQPIIWGWKYMKPNGIFFLEVSFLSQYIALALAIEIAIFKRPWRMILFSAVLLSTFAGTGLLLILLTGPVLIGRTRMRSMVVVIIALTLVALAAYELGWVNLVSHRFNELNETGQSANMRFMEPLHRLITFSQRPGSFFYGIGAGQIEKAYNFQWWPFTKAAIEYGYLPGLLFYTFFLVTLFDHPPSRRLAFVLAVWFSIEGALLTSVNPLTCVMLSTMFAVQRPLRRRREPEVAEQPTAPPPPKMRLGDAPSRRSSEAPVPQEGRRPKAVADPFLPIEPIQPAEPEPETVEALAAEPAARDPHIAEPDTEGRLIYAIGDVHGRADLLAELIGAIELDIAKAENPSGQKPMIVFLGDYVDRGPQSREVLDMMVELTHSPEWEVICLTGNHEEALLDFLDKRTAGASWTKHGGATTLASYGVPMPPDVKDRDNWAATRAQFADVIPSEHVTLMRGMKDTLVIGDLLFVHAGVRPGVSLAEQSRRDLLYIRPDFLDHPVDCGKLVVHGHTPQERAYSAPGRLCLDSGAYATGVLTAARFNGKAPELIEVGVPS